jgi:DNA topoisomerase-2
MKEKQEKESEIKILIGKSIELLWKEDLNCFLEEWDKFETDMAVQDSTRPGQAGKGAKKGKALNLKKPKKNSLDDSDVSMNDEDDDDFMPAKKKTNKHSVSLLNLSFFIVVKSHL